MLTKIWGSVNLPKGQRVFVPLCGKSSDMIWLAEQGFDVIGVELSPLAVQAFFLENNIKAEQTRMGAFIKYQAGRIVILCGDFFKLNKTLLGEVHYIYDRASLTALPAHLRGRYVRKVLKLCNVPMLLLTVEENVASLECSETNAIDEEVQSLYEKDYTIILSLTQQLISADNEISLCQKAYLISPLS